MTTKAKFADFDLHRLPGALTLESSIPNILTLHANSPSSFMADVWEKTNAENRPAGTRGQTLLLGLVALFIRESIGPFYVSCGVRGIPTHTWDLVLPHENGAVTAISSNVTLKERWKVENLAAWGLKREHEMSRAFVVVRNNQEAENLRRLIVTKKAEFIDSCVQACSTDLDQLITDLKGFRYVERNSIIDRGQRDKGLGPIHIH